MDNQKQIDNLINVYRNSREKLLNTILDSNTSVSSKEYSYAILKQVEQELALLRKKTNNWIEDEIPKSYEAGIKDTIKQINDSGVDMDYPKQFSTLHIDAMNILAREMSFEIAQGTAMVGRQIKRYVEASQDEALRKLGLETVAEGLSSGQTTLQIKKNLISKIQNEGFCTIQYGSGDSIRQVPIDVYAATVARSTTREATNSATLNQLTDNDYDLVKISEHSPTCGICSMYQGRVFSISGNDKRFPKLDIAFNSGYFNIHANCRHVVTPYIIDMQTDPEVEAEMKNSNRPFEDARSDKEKNEYKGQQVDNRRARQDLYQYERYKLTLRADAPQSLSVFKRIKNEDGDRWAILQSQYKGMGYYNKAVANEPEVTKVVMNVAKKTNMDTAGLEYRIKSEESYIRKIKSNYNPVKNSKFEINDILRYTYTADADNLAEKTIKSIDNFAKEDYNTIVVKNSWLDNKNPYKGINTIIQAPNGQKFEMQYHTQESFDLKNGAMHRLYEKQRLIEDKTDPEYIRLRDEMFDLSDKLQIPNHIDEVKNK